MLLLDVLHTWLVSPSGGSGNSGHPASYPINLASSAKDALGDVIAAPAVAGDTILLFPGTHSRNATLTMIANTRLIGVGARGAIKVVMTDAMFASMLYFNTANDVVHLENFTCEHLGGTSSNGLLNTSAAAMRSITLKDMLFINDAAAKSPMKTAMSLTQHLQLSNCIFTGLTTTAIVMWGQGAIRDCRFECTPNPSTTAFNAIELVSSEKLIAFNCAFNLVSNNSSSTKKTTLSASSAAFKDCSFRCITDTDDTGDVVAVYAAGTCVFERCRFYASSASGSEEQLRVATGSTAILIDCDIDPTKVYCEGTGKVVYIKTVTDSKNRVSVNGQTSKKLVD